MNFVFESRSLLTQLDHRLNSVDRSASSVFLDCRNPITADSQSCQCWKVGKSNRPSRGISCHPMIGSPRHTNLGPCEAPREFFTQWFPAGARFCGLEFTPSRSRRR